MNIETNSPDGYLIEECWDFYYRNNGDEDIEENRKWLHIDWQPCYKKKFYKTKEIALEAISQMAKNWQTPIYKNHKFRLIPVFKGIPEEIDNQIKQIQC